MECLMLSTADPCILELKETAQRLRMILDHLETPTSQPVLTAPQISELLTTLLRAGECMRSIAVVGDEERLEMLSAYRAQVERLRTLLPSIHGALLRERARLALEQQRLHAVTAWAQASQQNL